MAWVSMPTFTSGNVLTAAQMMILVGNLEETAVALASTPGDYPVASGANQLAMRSAASDVVDAIGTTTSTSYGSLSGGPAVTVVCGTKAAVSIFSYLRNASNLNGAAMTFEVTGAHSSSAVDNRSIYLENASDDSPAVRCGATIMVTGMTAGSSTFTTQYRAIGGGTATFATRRIMVHPY